MKLTRHVADRIARRMVLDGFTCTALAEIAEPDALTFREDYEFYGASKGTVCASYSGHCEVCGLGVDFTYEREFYKGAEQAREETLDV